MVKKAENEIVRKTNREVTGSKKKSTIFDLIKAGKEQFSMALPKHMDADRFVRIALTCVKQNPKLAECTQESLLGALMTSSQLGLEAGVLGQAYLIPYKIKGTMECQFQLSYKGMVELLRRSGQLSNIRAHTVYENDHFEYELGLDLKLVHKPVLINRGKEIGFYVVAELSDGNKSFHFMSKEDILEHEKKNRKGDYMSSIWKNHFNSMAHKTVAKQLLKWLPVSIEYLENVEKDETVNKSNLNNISEVNEEIINDNDYDVIDADEIVDGIEDKQVDQIAKELFKN